MVWLALWKANRHKVRLYQELLPDKRETVFDRCHCGVFPQSVCVCVDINLLDKHTVTSPPLSARAIFIAQGSAPLPVWPLTFPLMLWSHRPKNLFSPGINHLRNFQKEKKNNWILLLNWVISHAAAQTFTQVCEKFNNRFAVRGIRTWT